jgi:hypothetical protein
MMKKNINYLLIICAVLFFTSCEKNAVQQIDYAPTGAFVKLLRQDQQLELKLLQV